MDSWYEQESALADLDDAALRLAAGRPPAGPAGLGAEPIEDAAQTVPCQRAGAFLDVAIGQRAAVHPNGATRAAWASWSRGELVSCSLRISDQRRDSPRRCSWRIPPFIVA